MPINTYLECYDHTLKTYPRPKGLIDPRSEKNFISENYITGDGQKLVDPALVAGETSLLEKIRRADALIDMINEGLGALAHPTNRIRCDITGAEILDSMAEHNYFSTIFIAREIYRFTSDLRIETSDIARTIALFLGDAASVHWLASTKVLCVDRRQFEESQAGRVSRDSSVLVRINPTGPTTEQTRYVATGAEVTNIIARHDVTGFEVTRSTDSRPITVINVWC